MKKLYTDILEDLTREGVPESFIVRQMDLAGSVGLRYADYFDYIYDQWDVFREFKGLL